MFMHQFGLLLTILKSSLMNTSFFGNTCTFLSLRVMFVFFKFLA
jgi:hypothetical protein